MTRRFRAICGLSLLLAIGAAPRDVAGGVGGACPSVAFGAYGAGCAFAFDVPGLKAAVDPGACTLTFTLSGQIGCCNTFIKDRIFIVGAQPTNLPIPIPLGGPGCTLLATPDLLLIFPAAAGNTFTVPIPPIDVTVYMQGVNHYVTFGVASDYNWSNGLKVDIG